MHSYSLQEKFVTVVDADSSLRLTVFLVRLLVTLLPRIALALGRYETSVGTVRRA
jgi:hypothetical protein